jgi:hypothetical protein
MQMREWYTLFVDPLRGKLELRYWSDGEDRHKAFPIVTSRHDPIYEVVSELLVEVVKAVDDLDLELRIRMITNILTPDPANLLAGLTVAEGAHGSQLILELRRGLHNCILLFLLKVRAAVLRLGATS